MKTFQRSVITLILISFHGNLLSQNYFPMDPGTTWYYIFGSANQKAGIYNFVEVISSPNYVFNGKTYQALTEVIPEVVADSSELEFKMAFDTIYLRKDSLGNIYYFDQHSRGENLFIPSTRNKGVTWKSFDSRYEFKIVSLKAVIQSYSIRYRRCLVISLQRLDNPAERKPVLHYFRKGIGLVGTKYDNQITMMLVKKEDGNAAFTNPVTSFEQKACDYFFSNIFRQEYSDYKVIEFENVTDTTRYWGIVHKCKNWDDSTKGQIVSATPERSIRVIATTDVRVKKRRKNSGRLKIGVWSRIKVGESYFVLIGAYRKLRFADYFLIELDMEGKVIGTCKQGEII